MFRLESVAVAWRSQVTHPELLVPVILKRRRAAVLAARRSKYSPTIWTACDAEWRADGLLLFADELLGKLPEAVATMLERSTEENCGSQYCLMRLKREEFEGHESWLRRDCAASQPNLTFTGSGEAKSGTEEWPTR